MPWRIAATYLFCHWPIHLPQLLFWTMIRNFNIINSNIFLLVKCLLTQHFLIQGPFTILYEQGWFMCSSSINCMLWWVLQSKDIQEYSWFECPNNYRRKDTSRCRQDGGWSFLWQKDTWNYGIFLYQYTAYIETLLLSFSSLALLCVQWLTLASPNILGYAHWK